MIKKLLIGIIAAMLLFPSALQASHYMGGEVTWECMPNGNYRFILKMYRECNGINYGTTTNLTVTGHPSVTTINMSLVTQTDISPNCHPQLLNIDCSTVNANNTGAVEEWVWTTDVTYPAGVVLSGVPPLTGWVFANTSCCRNPSANLSTNSSWYIRAIMYNYANRPSGVCDDNSPTFKEVPSTVICSGYPFTYNPTAWDVELDSLSYEWAQPLQSGINNPCIFNSGYSYTSPLPGPTQDSRNSAGTVDPVTGEISFESYTNGAFVTVVKVTAWKCGIIAAEIFREMQVVLLQCGLNNQPIVGAPFINNGLPSYIDTVYAGDLVTFSMTGVDFDQIQIPGPITEPQTLTLTASGGQFGTNYTATGCITPPCATLNPAPTPSLTAYTGVSTNFSWQTDCSHLNADAGCFTTTNIFTFLIKVQDNYCPAPAINISTITVIVLAPDNLPAPDPRCTQVHLNGDVTITFERCDTMAINTYDSYHVYTSTSPAGPYTLLDSIFTPWDITTSYTHVGANAQVTPRYYKFKTRSGCDGDIYSTEFSDSIATMRLSVVNPSNGTAQLNWTEVYSPRRSTNTGIFYIYREYPLGTVILLDSTTQLNYIDTITFCDETVNYYIEVYDSIGCWSVSNIDGDRFSDLFPPSTLSFNYISVTPTNEVEMGWTASSSLDCGGYIIYNNQAGVWVEIDTVYGINTVTYIDMLAGTPELGIESYCIAAFDTCWNTSPLGNEHNTIYTTAAVDVCSDLLTVSWTEYINLNPALAGYNVYSSLNGAAYILEGTVGSTTYTYDLTNLAPQGFYCFYVEAYDAGATVISRSNETCIIATQPSQPKFCYLITSTVRQPSQISSNQDHILLKIFTDTAALVRQYKIERSLDLVGPWDTIARLGSSIEPIRYYQDFSAGVNLNSYYYRVTVVDSCGIDAITSNYGKTILLFAEANANLTNELTWNEYADWDAGVFGYNIYRSVDEQWDPFPIASLPVGVTAYIDDVSGLSLSQGKFAYMIEGLENLGNQYNLSDTSISNIAYANQFPRIFVPNAFAPDGYNKIFYPVGMFVNNDDYEMQIYNRWGQQLFVSREFSTGWDGTYNGHSCEPGNYVYLIRFKTAEGLNYEKRGVVTLIK